ncbi:MAG: hypothetical protein R3Y63_06760, partial [Eubacteriales bacterium]
MSIGNRLKLSLDFPLTYTVHTAFTVHGVPSRKFIVTCGYPSTACYHGFTGTVPLLSLILSIVID